MPYELDIRNEPDYLYVRATGVRSIETILAIASDCVAACEKYRYEKILVDVQAMTGTLAVLDSYNLGTKGLGELGPRQWVQAAVLDLEENRTRFEFLENVIVNSGFNIRIFSEAGDAERWLGESKGVSSKPDGQ